MDSVKQQNPIMGCFYTRFNQGDQTLTLNLQRVGSIAVVWLGCKWLLLQIVAVV
jgi:hypothetical protein